MNERFENDLACYLHYDDAPRRPARARRRKRARKHCARRFFARCCGVLCLCAGVELDAFGYEARVPAADQAASVTVTTSDRFPYFSARMAVITLVVLAGYTCLRAFLA